MGRTDQLGQSAGGTQTNLEHIVAAINAGTQVEVLFMTNGQCVVTLNDDPGRVFDLGHVPPETLILVMGLIARAAEQPRAAAAPPPLGQRKVMSPNR